MEEGTRRETLGGESNQTLSSDQKNNSKMASSQVLVPPQSEKPSDVVSSGQPSAHTRKSSANKRAKSSPPNSDSQDSNDDDSDLSSHSSDDEKPRSNKSTRKGDPHTRLNLRKEKKSMREKARRQRENALFEELANMCNVPPDTRDKSSVLKAVIKRVEELKSRGIAAGMQTASLLNGLQAFASGYGGSISSSSSVSSFGSLEQPKANPPVPSFLGPQGGAQPPAPPSYEELLMQNSRQWTNPTATTYPVYPATLTAQQPLASFPMTHTTPASAPAFGYTSMMPPQMPTANSGAAAYLSPAAQHLNAPKGVSAMSVGHLGGTLPAFQALSVDPSGLLIAGRQTSQLNMIPAQSPLSASFFPPSFQRTDSTDGKDEG